MGNRANYVLIENGQSSIYFSRWGAPYIPAVLLAGPDETIAYMRALTPVTYLLDDVWAEGGLLLDLDKRELKYFGGSPAPYVRRLQLHILQSIWSGWSVEETRFGVADLAQALGWSLEGLLDTCDDDPRLFAGTRPLLPDVALKSARRLKSARCVLSVRTAEVSVQDYTLSSRLIHVLSMGPRLLSLLFGLREKTNLPNEADPNLPAECAYLDATAHVLWISIRWGLGSRHIAAIATRWPGWRVDGFTGGLVRQVILSGRDATDVAISYERALSELIEELAEGHTTNPQALATALSMVDDSPLKNETGITFGPGFFSADLPPLAPDERWDVIMRVLHKTSASEKWPLLFG